MMFTHNFLGQIRESVFLNRRSPPNQADLSSLFCVLRMSFV